MTRLLWSDKIQNSGARIISWITPNGLKFKHTPIYMALTTETRLVKLWGEPLKIKCLTRIKRRSGSDLPQDAHISQPHQDASPSRHRQIKEIVDFKKVRKEKKI